MTKKEAAELLDLVIERAPKLRELGVLSVDVCGLRVELAPIEPDAPDDDESIEVRAAREEDQLRENPWNDPATFGRSSTVPGNDPRKKKG